MSPVALGASRVAGSTATSLVVEEDALVLVLEPLLRLGLLDLVVEADAPLARSPLGDARAARPLHHHEEVHTVDTCGGASRSVIALDPAASGSVQASGDNRQGGRDEKPRGREIESG